MYKESLVCLGLVLVITIKELHTRRFKQNRNAEDAASIALILARMARNPTSRPLGALPDRYVLVTIVANQHWRDAKLYIVG